jgi:hypothetical protein
MDTTFGEEAYRFETPTIEKIPPLDMILCRCGRSKHGGWSLLDCGCWCYKMAPYCCAGCKDGSHGDECEIDYFPGNITESCCCHTKSEVAESEGSDIVLIRVHSSDCEFRSKCDSHTR